MLLPVLPLRWRPRPRRQPYFTSPLRTRITSVAARRHLTAITSSLLALSTASKPLEPVDIVRQPPAYADLPSSPRLQSRPQLHTTPASMAPQCSYSRMSEKSRCQTNSTVIDTT